MKLFSKAAVGGLLWLTCTVAFADTLFFTGQPENVDQGGQFTAFLASNPSQTLLTYCVDDLNEVSITTPPAGYSVNLVDLANNSQVFTDTRYGQTPAASFSTNLVTVPSVIGTAQDRYAMAAWLITQYSFNSGNAAANNSEIQNAIWTLLNATAAPLPDSDGIGTYVMQAESWIVGEMATNKLTAFENTVVIYSPTAVVGVADPARYTVGNQEMIGFTSAPEPATLAMLGAGLLFIGLLGKRIKPLSKSI
jgi:PEP-CTERM motif